MAELDIIAELKQKIVHDRANVWQRIQDYFKSVNSADWLNKVQGLDPAGTMEFYDNDYGLVLTDFTYQTKSPVFTPEVVSERVFQNGGDTEAQEVFSFLKTTQEAFSFGFKEGLKIGAKAKATIGLPLVGESEIELSAEVTFDANQQWTDTTTKTWSLNDTIRIPAHSNVRVTGYINDAVISADFSGVVRATKGKVLTWFQLKGNAGYTETPLPLVILLTQDQRTFPVSGTFQGAEGVAAYTKVEPFTQ